MDIKLSEMRSKILLFMALMVFPIGKTINADIDVNNAQAVFIYNFLSHVKWPESAIGSKYTIGIIGRTPTAAYLKKYTSNRKVGSKPIEIVQFVDVAELKDCQVLLVSRGKSSEMSAINQKLSGKSCLVVGEKPGTTKTGAIIDFNIVNGKLRYKIDMANATKANLYISSTLMQMSM